MSVATATSSVFDRSRPTWYDSSLRANNGPTRRSLPVASVLNLRGTAGPDSFAVVCAGDPLRTSGRFVLLYVGCQALATECRPFVEGCSACPGVSAC